MQILAPSEPREEGVATLVLRALTIALARPFCDVYRDVSVERR